MNIKKSFWWLLAAIALVGNIGLPYLFQRWILHFTVPKPSPSSLPPPSPAPKTLQDYYNDSYWQLNSAEKHHAVRIPFYLKNSLIYIDGNWSGRVVPCLFDTGVPITVWPEKLNLPNICTGIPTVSNWVGGFKTQDELVIIPNLRFKNYQLRNCNYTPLSPSADLR